MTPQRRRTDLRAQLGVRMDVLFKGEMLPSDRDLIAHIERGILERIAATGQAPRFALVVGVQQDAPADVRRVLEAIE